MERRVLGALLTAPNEPVAAADLLAAAWPDGGPEDASEQLSEAIDVLRDLVDPHRFPGADGNLIHLSGDRYMLCADRADVDSFGFDDAVLSARAARGRGDLEAAGDELRAGLGRWRGALLEGFDGAFFAAVRERFEDVRLQAFEALYEVELERGLHHEILPDLAQQVAAHPLREGYRKTFLLALYRTDRKQDALNQYAELRKRLQRMENRSPSADVRELARRIAVDDPTLLPESEQPVPVPRAKPKRYLDHVPLPPPGGPFQFSQPHPLPAVQLPPTAVHVPQPPPHPVAPVLPLPPAAAPLVVAPQPFQVHNPLAAAAVLHPSPPARRALPDQRRRFALKAGAVVLSWATLGVAPAIIAGVMAYRRRKWWHLVPAPLYLAGSTAFFLPEEATGWPLVGYYVIMHLASAHMMISVAPRSVGGPGQNP
ncbi:hypothetical protein HPO96_36360 [Kribbella sandramycini]|uniref:DNA-binding SARP family transcriptional activator n=1 Tax=Kribbella sandramycini TaxID=60450 RepID=A0A7Y4L9G8_9ACTN|nr:DNA-binding SARP family transcriptional activator [Kribbella sandramycini]NOL45732.1 hypothetical protein [Kribbella sandramycini]